MSRRGWWLAVTGAVLALVAQGVVAGLVWQHTRPRLPALAAVGQTLDRAVAGVVAAVADRAAVAVSPVVPVTSCQNTPLAKGSRFSRTADFYTDVGNEEALIGQIASALPADDHARRDTPVGGGPPPLSADLGNGVSLHVTELGHGWVTAIAETGCRTPERSHPAVPSAPAPATARMTEVLAAAGTTPTGWQVDSVTCPVGAIVTVATISPTANADNLPVRLAGAVPAGARRFTSDANRVAWREEHASLIVAASDDGTHITVQDTTTC